MSGVASGVIRIHGNGIPTARGPSRVALFTGKYTRSIDRTNEMASQVRQAARHAWKEAIEMNESRATFIVGRIVCVHTYMRRNFSVAVSFFLCRNILLVVCAGVDVDALGGAYHHAVAVGVMHLGVPEPDVLAQVETTRSTGRQADKQAKGGGGGKSSRRW